MPGSSGSLCAGEPRKDRRNSRLKFSESPVDKVLTVGILPVLFAHCPVTIRLMTSSLLEEAAKLIPSQQVLVNVVSKRVRQLTAGHRPMVETGPRMGFSDIALTEIIEGKLKFEAAPAPGAADGQK